MLSLIADHSNERFKCSNVSDFKDPKIVITFGVPKNAYEV
jgi:hypothetical protein